MPPFLSCKHTFISLSRRGMGINAFLIKPVSCADRSVLTLRSKVIWVWLLWNDAPAGGMKTAAILGGGISKANTLERRPSRWDKDVVDPVRCGIANSGQSLLRGRWL